MIHKNSKNEDPVNSFRIHIEKLVNGYFQLKISRYLSYSWVLKTDSFLTSITTVYVWVWFLGGPRLLWDSQVPVSWSRCSVLLPRSFCWGLDAIQVQASCDYKGVWRYLDTRIRIRSTESGRNEGCIQSQDQMSTEWIWFVCYFCLFLYPLCYSTMQHT